MKNLPLTILGILILTGTPIVSLADNYNLKTYYPSPYGTFKSFRLIPRAAITPSTNCPIGTLYSNLGDNSEIYYCSPSSTPQYLPLQGVWTASNNYLFPSDTQTRLSNTNLTVIENEKVGIGTTTPAFKLTLMNDGGIQTIDRQASTNRTLNITGAGTRLIYYPLKKAFRAGFVAGAQWDNGNIGDYSTAMGFSNTASGTAATVSGGQTNTASGQNSVVSSGQNNLASALDATILGGTDNTASQNVSKAGGFNNTVSGANSAVSGGSGNTASGASAVIIGGQDNNALQQYNMVGGGRNNTANGLYASVAGGRSNTASALGSVVLGGQDNTSSSQYAMIGGGRNNRTQHSRTLIMGGQQNTVRAKYGVIAGGEGNMITSDSTVNSFVYPVILGGESNTLDAPASSFGSASIIVGGANNILNSDRSLVAGRNMNLDASADGTFLWGHSNNTITAITTTDAFIIYSGRVGIRETNPGALLEINGNNSSDPYLALTSIPSQFGNRFIITNNGRVGVGVTNPAYPLQFSNGAYVSATGVFQDASSQKFKTQITKLSLNTAQEVFSKLNPVRFHYKNDPQEEYVGFIAEDVPSLVADQERQGLYPSDITAILIKIAQDQDQVLKENQRITESLFKEIQELEHKIQTKTNR